MNESLVFYFEKDMDYDAHVQWIRTYWKLSFVYAAVYLLLIHLGQLWMQNRRAFQLRAILAVWNATLALFSLTGACRIVPQITHELRRHGFEYTVCDPTAYKYNGIIQFWIWHFAMSKVFELGDTAFIVLRKRRLPFLHWYHHVTVLVYTWYSTQQVIPSARWFVSMNYAVHAAMYSYYALKAMKFEIPRSVAMAITSAQLLQMFGGLYANWGAYTAIIGGRPCDTDLWNIKVSLMMYGSYCGLFAHLFYTSYVKKQWRRKID